MPRGVRDSVLKSGEVPSPKPVREEWDFRAPFAQPTDFEVQPSEFLEDSEVLPCYEYEYTRLDPLWKKDALNWRKEASQQTFRGFFVYWVDCWRAESIIFHSEFYFLWPEWPHLPYLKIPKEVRLKRLKLWTGRDFRLIGRSKGLKGVHGQKHEWDKPPLEIVRMSELFAYRDAFWQKSKFYKGPYQHAKVGDVISFSGSQGGLWDTCEFVAFNIDYSDPDKRIVDRFREALKVRRRANEIEPRRTQGTNSPIRTMRDWLVALGAWKLTKQFGWNPVQLEHLTHDVSGRPLYSGAKSLRKAIARLTGLDGPLLPFAEWERQYKHRQ